MTGQPVKQDVVATLALLAAQANLLPSPPPDDPNTAAEAYLIAWCEEGKSLYALAQHLNISRYLLSRWVKADPDRYQSYTRARADGADALVDEGGSLLDEALPQTVGVANARAQWRKWLAGQVNPEQWGSKQAPTQLAIGSLHLHAVQRPPISQIAPPPQGTGMGAGNGEYPTETPEVVVRTLPSGGGNG